MLAHQHPPGNLGSLDAVRQRLAVVCNKILSLRFSQRMLGYLESEAEQLRDLDAERILLVWKRDQLERGKVRG